MTPAPYFPFLQYHSHSATAEPGEWVCVDEDDGGCGRRAGVQFGLVVCGKNGSRPRIASVEASESLRRKEAGDRQFSGNWSDDEPVSRPRSLWISHSSRAPAGSNGVKQQGTRNAERGDERVESAVSTGVKREAPSVSRTWRTASETAEQREGHDRGLRFSLGERRGAESTEGLARGGN
ncbi:uncharacterized protein N7459_003557 [Penicillium hispanicum]|uniref:uncharacterized protein n=1 Tax=Penicillium hispanicum TaxID=1080232 RepID=UPI00253FEC9E|nr:uncharacterized protein N7459_003557 [Penicillium hispanicum]KAJ5587792.1 hypothetical protein N7459_003557 [Penicillium hispanicum]